MTSREFRTYGRPLEMVLSLKYLGRVLLAADYDWTVVFQTPARARMFWRRISRILIRKEARPRVSGFLF